MKPRRISHEMWDCRPACGVKSPLLSVIIFTALIFFIYADRIASYVSLQSVVLTAETEPEAFQTEKALEVRKIKSTVVHGFELYFTREEIEEVGRENQNSLISPFNVSKEERIAWFRRKLPKFRLLWSDDLTREFHGRVLEFFNRKCELQFFMTWISPAASFGRREILAVESVFKTHPHGCLTILSRTMDSADGYRKLKPLLDRGFKVLAVAPDLPFLFKNTPAETWLDDLKSGKKDPGEIPLAQNLSNLIRLAVLYKYGGVYLDTDFVVMKSFKGLKNSIGAQSMDVLSQNWTRLNNAVLVFDMNHPLLLKFMEEFASTFDGNKWGHNGPYLVSRVVERVEGKPGYNFSILPPMAFYPVNWNNIRRLFQMPANRADSRWVEAKLRQLSGETYGIHLWNKQSNRFAIEEGSVMARLISDHCIICEGIISSSIK